MLKETISVRQIAGEPERKWFTDNFFDLIIWMGENKDMEGFQLCYDKGMNDRALTWKKPSTYTHRRIDDGEEHPLEPKKAPILIADGFFDSHSVANRFREESKNIDGEVFKFVYDKLVAFGKP